MVRDRKPAAYREPVLHGIDDIDWSGLDGACGPCTEAPDILRAIASPDAEVADEGRYELFSSIWHQGTVYPVTAEVVPFLVELATTPGVHRREDLLRILGELCDPDQVDGTEQARVRAAVAVHSGPLRPLLDDPDPVIRLHAAYAAAWSGPHFADTLRQRWAAETDPGVRATVLAGLTHLGPDASAALLDAALRDPEPPLRAVAALALVRAGRPIPAAALQPVGAAFAELEPFDNPWSGESSAWERVFGATAPDAAAVLAAPLAGAGVPATRTLLLHSINARFRRSRSAVPHLMPLVVALLGDPEPQVRSNAASAARAAGEGAAPFFGLPAVTPSGRTAADRLFGVARSGNAAASEVVVRLGLPGFAGTIAAVREAGTAYEVLDGAEPPFHPEALAVIRQAIGSPAAPDAPPASWQDIAALLGVLRSWGPSAADAVPEITALLGSHPGPAITALAAMGAAALPTVPDLTVLAEHGNIRAGHLVLRLTGDPGPLVRAAAETLREPAISTDDFPGTYELPDDLRRLADAGPAAAGLAPVLARWLTGVAGEEHELRYVQVGAARVVWRATGDTGAVLPTLRAVIRRGFAPAGDAAALLADIGAGEDLVPQLRQLLKAEPRARIGAALALYRLGAPPADLAARLVSALRSGWHGSEAALDALVTVGAVTAVPALTDLADRDERLPVSGLGDAARADDRLRRRIRATIAALTALPSTGTAAPR